jgi:hypothetical protein
MQFLKRGGPQPLREAEDVEEPDEATVQHADIASACPRIGHLIVVDHDLS